MPPTNDFVPFCNENTGTNLPSQAAYIANPALPIGNQPGVASSSFNNKAIRQGTTMASVLAQLMSDVTGTSVNDNQNSADHAIPIALLAQLKAAVGFKRPVLTAYLTGSGNHNVSYKFQVVAANATVGATYSDGTTTFTVTATIAAQNEVIATGAAAPAVNGTLTKLSGTGDATIVFYAVRAPLYIKVRMSGGGGGGGGSGTGAPGTGGAGGTTSFGTSFLQCTGGTGGNGSTNTATAPGGVPTGGDINISGGIGCGGSNAPAQAGAAGAPGVFGGSASTIAGAPGNAPPPNSGAGGGGGGGNTGITPGGSGAAGAYLEKLITTPLSTYAWAVGAAGTFGAAGSGAGFNASNGASGFIEVIEYYQ